MGADVTTLRDWLGYAAGCVAATSVAVLVTSVRAEYVSADLIALVAMMSLAHGVVALIPATLAYGVTQYVGSTQLWSVTLLGALVASVTYLCVVVGWRGAPLGTQWTALALWAPCGAVGGAVYWAIVSGRWAYASD